MTQETLLQRTEEVVALVRVLRSERDQTLARLTASEAEKDRMRPIPAEVKSNVAETLGSTQLTQTPQNGERQLELEECRKALLQTQADLEHTKDDLRRTEVRLRTQTMKMRQQAANTSGQNQ